MMNVETGRKGDHAAEPDFPLSHGPQHFHLSGRCDDLHCCGGGFDDDLGHGFRRDHCYAHGHVAVRCYILRPRYALDSGRGTGHALCWHLMFADVAGRRDDYQRGEKRLSLWARGPYGKDGRKP